MEKNLDIKSINIDIKKISTFFALLLLIAVVPMYIHSQFITGPYINAILLIACIFVGPKEAIMLGLIPSSIALVSGLLPLPLAPIIPFIMMSNAIYILLFEYFRKRNFFVSVGIASVSKFVFLQIIILFIANKIIDNSIISKVIIMLSWPQLLTAILGGVIAFCITMILNKNEKTIG